MLFIGQLQPLKGMHDLVAAIPLVASGTPGGRISNRRQRHANRAGENVASVSPRAGIARRTAPWNASNSCEPLPQPELVPLYQSCAVFVLPSHNDVYPNAVLEAMGCGRPCVVTSTAGVAELVTESNCGIVVPPRDPAALAAAINDVLSLPAPQRDEMGARGRRIVERLCATPVIAAQAIDSYREAIDRFNSGCYGVREFVR